MRKQIWLVLTSGTIISTVLLCLERRMPGSAPRIMALPGWIAVIQVWGFQGERGGIWAWILFFTANLLAYAYLSFIVFICLKIAFRKRGVLR
jgi:hypothetical protein